MKIHFDPKNARSVSFISHAHSDHIPRSFSGTLLASGETCSLSRREIIGECWHDSATINELYFKQYRSGHIHGSNQLLIENGSKVLYTGDLNLNGGMLTLPAETPKCDILILDTTFGDPMYVFPKRDEIIKEMVDWAHECVSHGRIPVIFGYALGKAQELTKVFSSEFEVYVSEEIYEFNKRYEKLGILLGEYKKISDYENGSDSVFIDIPQRRKNYPRDRFFTAFASGWTIKQGYRTGDSPHRGFPLSDHSDFYGLMEFVRKVSPQMVYTTHGFTKGFSDCLKEEGFYSEPVPQAQTAD